MPAEDRPGEPHDPGWCCNEHALIASLAFCYLGVRAELGEGRAVFLSRDAKKVHFCSPHWFVVVGTKAHPTGLFDSSVAFGPLNGLPVGYKRKYPQVAVSLNLPLPPSDELGRLVRTSPDPFVAMYEPQRSSVPGSAAIKHVSATPFGKWLTAAVGTQAGIWGRAALVVGQTLAAGEPQNPPRFFSKLGKLELWHWIATTPDVDDLVLGRAAVLG